MICIFCDMNCNNFGNYFRIIGLEHDLRQDDDGYIQGKAHYPKKYCYRANIPNTAIQVFRYSDAIDYLLPKEYIKWKKNRFGKLKEK